MKKFKSIFALILIILMILMCSCSKAKNKGYSLFKSSPIGFELEYPSYWDKEIDNKNKIVAFVSPNVGLDDNYRENLTVASQDAGDGIETIEDYIKAYKISLKQNLKNFELISEQPVTVDDNEAYEIIYTSQSDEKEESTSLKFMQTLVLKDKKVIIISYLAEPDSYSFFMPYIKTIMSTIKIK